MKSEIGDCVTVLFYKLWSKVLVKGQLKSESWWKRKLDKLINGPIIKIELNEELPVSVPVRFEDENPKYAKMLYEIFGKNIEFKFGGS